MADTKQTTPNQIPDMNAKTSDDLQEKDEDEGLCCYLEYFKEANEMENLIKNLRNIADDEIAMELSYERFRCVMNNYQEQPHLLDIHLQPFINLLLSIGMDPGSPACTVREAFIYLYLITKIRGYKIIVRHLPHEVSDLEPVLALLTQQGQTKTSCWESRYMLLMWLSIICMVPFDMSRFDGNAEAISGPTEPIMDRIINVAKTYLEVVDKCRDAASYLLSRFLTRPDVIKRRLEDVLQWALGVLTSNSIHDATYIKERNLMLGVLYMLSLLFKHGKREDLLDQAPRVLQTVTACGFANTKNSVIRKGSVKLIQRIGLIFLKQRVAAWRYQRGNRSLADNLEGDADANMKNMLNSELEDDDDEDYEIPDEIEEVIGQLLNGLRDTDTIVRWSAAKGIGRVTGRLPKELADDVVESVLELFSKSESDGSWHGGCLALAELGRRGLLLPERLNDVVPPVLSALLYDERRGTFSVGAHVRDAACYVCWSFARAYDPEQIKPHVMQIANTLVIVSLFDREVNVRRAASAAFQENVGRQGSFPHGIDILTKADYFAVGKRSHCYLELSSYVADFAEYTKSVINHIKDIKTQHWDSSIRQLSGEALSKLTFKAPDYMANTVLLALLPETTSMDVLVRHGSILAVAHITLSLSQVCATNNQPLLTMIGPEAMADLINIPHKLHEARQFRGHGGELMRQAVCMLIEKLSLARVPLEAESTIGLWQEILDDCVCHKEIDIQTAALRAIAAFISQYYKDDIGQVIRPMQEKILDKYLHHLQSNISEQRVGYSLALGALPAFMIANKLRPILSGLMQVTRVRDASWVDSRKSSLMSIKSIIQTVGVDARGSPNEVICPDNLPELYELFFLSLNDYTTDSRGDIGRLVREAALSGLHLLTHLVVENHSDFLTPHIVEVMFCLMVQQSCEKIDRTRELACNTFVSLLYHTPALPHVPEREKLQDLITKTVIAKVNWSSAGDCFPIVTPILQFPVYAYHALLGLIVSVGGITESVVQHSTTSLHDYVNNRATDRAQITRLADNVLKIMENFQKNDRIIMPMFKMINFLLSQNAFTELFIDPENPYPLSLLNKCRQEVTRCSNPQKLMNVTDVYCSLLIFNGIRLQTLTQLMIMLGHSYPRVRKTTAEKLYEAILIYDNIASEEYLDEVTSIVSDTRWDDSINVLRPIRNHLCELLHVKPPIKLSGSKAGPDSKVSKCPSPAT